MAENLKEYKKLEYFGISQNGLSTYEDIKPLLQYIGKTKIDGEELERYKEVKA